ncbi:tRNA threonylcarbamoyladenosine biosynthesis protein TsaB [Algoriphagus ratkowskyi]|uniref:tRNA (Adenosine(37)-N6)-threonylcarbamoyltransferase complex dimerization subunit type 1 TsaB n=1 Tax=Algoriphagus ratkowskyi TaxID=57028 RepID=A0A2W7QRW8_9BACT|nr:tRNA (adenosine(37)-N6)-threonylcarbamoyltransferase complex dimerization subunit type 1 TsaB [Algoriphagus ratkowskyi]PZX50741.1 tRNA threonylcarbamoyladenosine biosynthesis protein TsaB [Algoriphagus ratkowskyi]TXD75773.1 tRNA (adenosine(37)-N6)-threonylcarbamoyltransferase complex dimerization subunit type 1 TsaB [Algoriphagus ratkowskyi]
MTFILSLETSTPICSIAIHQNGFLLGEKSLDVPGAHSEKLMGMIKALLHECNLIIEQINAIAVSEGPGSYTGLRIGVSVAKGLAFARDIQLISVSTLKALSYGAKFQKEYKGLIVAMLDARRMEVYREVFDQDLQSVRKLDSEIIDETSFLDLLDTGKVYFVGDAVDKVSKVLAHPNAVFLNLKMSADYVGTLAYSMFERGEFADLAYFVPNYLKEFKALQSKKNPLLI